MRRTLLIAAAVAASALLGVRPAAAASILYFNDGSLGTNEMTAALAALPASDTVTTIFSPTTATLSTDLATFISDVASGNFQLVIMLEQSFGGGAYPSAWGAVGTYVQSGGAAIGDDFTTAAGTAFSYAFTGRNNNFTVSLTSPELTTGISNPVNLFNPGWITATTGLSLVSGATCGATFSNGDCAVDVLTGGRSFFNGFLADTFDSSSVGVQLYTNEIDAALAPPVSATPEPASLVLVSTGLLMGGRRLLRQRRS